MVLLIMFKVNQYKILYFIIQFFNSFHKFLDESQKVLDEFKHDLKMAILKLDDQLKEKVDK